MANHFPVLQVSRAGLTVISVPADVRTQAMYQMMDQGFVGLIFSCFIEDKNTKVGNLKMATKPPGAHEKHQGRAESLGAACKKGRAAAGSTRKAQQEWWWLDCDPKDGRTNDDSSVLPHSLAAQGGCSSSCRVCALRWGRALPSGVQPSTQLCPSVLQPLQEVWLSCEIS